MGFLFQNVSQLAGFLMNDSGSNSKSINGNGEKSETADFQLLLESMSNPKPAIQTGDSDKVVDDMAYLNTLLNSNFGAITGLDSKVNQGIEVKERAGITADLLQVLVSNQKDSITLNLSQSAISKLQSNLIMGEPHNKLTGLKMADTTSNLNPEKSVGVSFNLKALFNSKLNSDSNAAGSLSGLKIVKADTDPTLPIIIKDINGLTPKSDPKISDLFQMLSEYPDPIEMEIGDLQDSIMVPDTVDPANSKLVSSTFKFDLRDLLNAKPQEKVTGILTTSEKPAEKVVQTSNTVFNPVKQQIADFPLSNEPTMSFKLDAKPNEIKSPVLFDPPKTNSNSEKRSALANEISKEIISGDDDLTKATLNWPAAKQPNLKGRSVAVSQSDDLAPNSDPQQFGGRKIQFASFHKNSIQKNNDNQSSNSKSENHTAAVPKSDFDLSSFDGAIKTMSADKVLSQDIKAALSESAQIEQEQVTANVREMKNAILEAFGQKSGLVRMRLQPENLGEISIRLLWKDNGLTVSMKSDNKDSHKILTAGAADLKGHLEAVNLRVNEVNVSTQSDWDGKSLHASGQELAGDHKQSRQQRETSNESLAKRPGQWESEETSRDSAKNQRANGWVDLTA
jgi:flagellar hook-length control protein FliK